MLIFPIFISHRGCPQSCIYCDQYQISGVHDPDWDTLLNELQKFCNFHREEDKEIAFYGGSFTCLPLNAQYDLYNKVTPYLNENTHLRYSTRPDAITKEILIDSISKGVRTIELGIQDFNDEVLLQSQRGYDREKALAACSLVKSKGLKLSVQLMPGLPGYQSSSLDMTIKDTISVQPDYVRIYPTIVIKGTPLEVMYLNHEYTPMDIDTAVKDSCHMVESFENAGINVIKIGLTGLEFSNVVAGPFHPSFGELVRAEMLLHKVLSTHVSGQVLVISKSDVSLLLGHAKEYLTRIKQSFNQSVIKIKVSDSLKKGEVQYTETEEFELW